MLDLWNLKRRFSMFEKIYQDARTVARHRADPLAEERMAFLAERASQGYKTSTLRWLAAQLLIVAQHLPVGRGQKLQVAEIEEAAGRWLPRSVGRSQNTTNGMRESFRSTAVAWFRYLNRLEEPSAAPVPFLPIIKDFATCMQQERGFEVSTIERTCHHVEKFLGWFAQRHDVLSEVAIEDIDGYFAFKSGQGLVRVSIRSIADALRSFFHHAGRKGWCAGNIAAAIIGPRIYRLEDLPLGPRWEQVRALIATTEGDRPIDIRDRAVLLLLAGYGLRSGDVSRLRLEDLDWQNEILRIPRPKRRQAQQYPLVREVGDAIVRYLRQVRPRSGSREVFLTRHAPIRRLSQGSLWNVVAERMKRVGISARHRGPHSLRHACATHLLADGLSLQQVGEHLGHASVNVTRIYAKVDLTGLREVAGFDLGGLL
jgi:integrase/recombinase XerD